MIMTLISVANAVFLHNYWSDDIDINMKSYILYIESTQHICEGFRRCSPLFTSQNVLEVRCFEKCFKFTPFLHSSWLDDIDINVRGCILYIVHSTHL